MAANTALTRAAIPALLRSPQTPARIRRNSALIGLVAFLACAALYEFQPQIFGDIEGRLLDARFRWRGPLPATDLVALVAIDDRSLATVGHWPWPRARLARLVEAIHNAGAQAVGLDIVFSETEDPFAALTSMAGQEAANQVQSLRAALAQSAPDEVLARTLAAAGNVVTGHFFYPAPEHVVGLPPSSAEALAVLCKRSFYRPLPLTWLTGYRRAGGMAAAPRNPRRSERRAAGPDFVTLGVDGLLELAPRVRLMPSTT